MTSLERMMAAIHGEPFDMYPFVNPYPHWSMMPHWPEMLGLTFLHLSYGSDEERMRCHGAFHEVLGLDWIPVPGGATGQDKRYRIETEDGVPVLVDTIGNTRHRYDEFPRDGQISEPRYNSAREVEALPPPTTAEKMLAGHSFDMTRKFIKKYGNTVFLISGSEAPFPSCNRALGFDKFYDSLINDPSLLHAIMERHTESIIQHAKALAQLGVHGMRINEYWCSAELISEKHYLQFAFPYEQRAIQAIRDEGLVAILEFLGWVEPRLPHIAKLGVNCLQTESSLKGYRNDVGEYRKVLGEAVCILGNPRILQEGNQFRCLMAERGKELDEKKHLVGTWKHDAFDSGAIGFRESGGEHSQYDNILVTTIGYVQSVSPEGNLSTIWGSMKLHER